MSSAIFEFIKYELKEEIEIIKRNSGYFSISTRNFILLDMLNYLSPQTLSDFAETWNVEEPKLICKLLTIVLKFFISNNYFFSPL